MEYFVHNLYLHNRIMEKTFVIENYQFIKLKSDKQFDSPFFDVITYKVKYKSNNEEKSSCLYSDKNKTALDDICLILSLITSYDVQYSDGISKTLTQIDPRKFNLDSLNLSILFFYKKNSYSKMLRQILKTIRNDEWLNKYNNGTPLLLMKEAMKKQNRESQFLNCWIVWEHLFYLLNKNWISEETLKHKISAKDKISFILTHFGFKNSISKNEHKNIQKLANIRNQIVHKGVQPEFHSFPKEYWLFFELTQFVIAKILHIDPYDEIYNTFDKFEAFLKGVKK
jgi:hypothetical protein